jgi:fructose-1,6-bisphosphatase/sedoheptulose 1,7-bisphosphatase-like protein
MGLRNFFGKKLLGMVKDARRIEEQQEQVAVDYHETARLSSQVSQNNAAFVAYRISNGYLIQTVTNDETYQRRQAFMYCADHQAIADFIVSEATKTALGIGAPGIRGEQNMAQAKMSRQVVQRTPY